jgi:hypothetical protein
MSDRTVFLNGLRVPRFLYGTGWKEERTQRLTELALRQGFHGLDTANQRRRYHKAAAGQALAAARVAGLVTRNGLFLQTKFTESPAATDGPLFRLSSGSPWTPAWCP